MQLGCVRVTERALGHGVVTAGGDAAARAMIEAELDRALVEVPAFAVVIGRVRLVGLAGTVATLAQLDARLEHYDRDVVHHRVLSRSTSNSGATSSRQRRPRDASRIRAWSSAAKTSWRPGSTCSTR